MSHLISFGLASYREKNKEIKSIEDLIPQRKRKAPERFKLGNRQTHHFPQTAKEHYK